MESTLLRDNMTVQPSNSANDNTMIEKAIEKAWSKAAICWPVNSVVAVNPLRGYEHLCFDDFMVNQYQSVINQNHHDVIRKINRISIKWLSLYFDEGQATISLPDKDLFLYDCVMPLILSDSVIPRRRRKRLKNIVNSISCTDELTEVLLKKLDVPETRIEEFVTSLITTLPGWSAYLQYFQDWKEHLRKRHVKQDYLAIRLALFFLFEGSPEILLSDDTNPTLKEGPLAEIKKNEISYARKLLQSLPKTCDLSDGETPLAQFVFCIDVRSEPMRRALESQGNIQTFSMAGFFSLPISIKNELTQEVYASCPALVKPKHVITHQCHPLPVRLKRNIFFKTLYQSLKYAFMTPFALVEGIGWFSGLRFMHSLFPKYNKPQDHRIGKIGIAEIPKAMQVEYAATFLKSIGLLHHFSDCVVICGHAGKSKNNVYASALHCGACGGHSGAINAKVMAKILNQTFVRDELRSAGIHIPSKTHFIPAEHNTTTDDVVFLSSEKEAQQIKPLLSIVQSARSQVVMFRNPSLSCSPTAKKAIADVDRRANDWSEVRPEWGLSKNASIIIAPRALTRSIDLEGRAFLHSYDWRQDPEGSLLESIMTAPVVVAQWINAQYLFSTLDPVAFGGGSKLTQNVLGKIGVMQGNGSDLMHGLPMQSVFQDDKTPYHIAQRLMVVVYGDKQLLTAIVNKHENLSQLFKKHWLHLYCINPESGEQAIFMQDGSWSQLKFD